MDNETILFDRIEMIKVLSALYDLDNHSYIAFSGGKDSCVLSKLIDLALPNNKIPRVYKNTGIEYPQMVNFVKESSKLDNRIIIIPPKKHIKNTLDIVGYPFKSKMHSNTISIYQNNIEKCERYKNLIDNNLNLLKDYEFIHNLPKGVKTFVKYYYGVRERELYHYEDCP